MEGTTKRVIRDRWRQSSSTRWPRATGWCSTWRADPRAPGPRLSARYPPTGHALAAAFGQGHLGAMFSQWGKEHGRYVAGMVNDERGKPMPFHAPPRRSCSRSLTRRYLVGAGISPRKPGSVDSSRAFLHDLGRYPCTSSRSTSTNAWSDSHLTLLWPPRKSYVHAGLRAKRQTARERRT